MSFLTYSFFDLFSSDCASFSIILPFLSTIILSHINFTRDRLCEIKIIEKFRFFFNSISNSKIENLVELSSAETHSSQIKILGFNDIAAAITTLCLSPPLTLAGPIFF